MIKKLALGLGLIGVLIYGYNYYQINFTKINHEVLVSTKLKEKEELKILQISDMHNKKFSKDNKSLLEKIKVSNPDIIVITGDLIDGKTKDLSYIFSFIKKLYSINNNIYYVNGNHEYRSGKVYELIRGLKSLGANVINNDNRTFIKDNLEINICGIDDPYDINGDIKSAFKGINKKNFTLLLAHSPGIIIEGGDTTADLILSGHTHGGQVRVPIIGGVVAPGQGFFPRYDKGIFKVNSTVLYIDSGLGTSTFPIRFLNRSQISLITIKG